MDVQKAIQQEMEQFMGQQFSHFATRHFNHIPEILKKHSPHALKIPLDNYRELNSVDADNCTYTQAGSCCNLLTGQTMASLDMDFEPYMELQKDVEDAIKFWNEETGKVKTRLQNKLEALSDVEKKSGRTIDMPTAKA
jgi:hypothetical protein